MNIICTVKHVESKPKDQTHLHQTPLPLYSDLLRACKKQIKSHLETNFQEDRQ